MFSYNLNVPQCNHFKADGARCGSPALREQRFCYFHKRLRRRPSKAVLPMLDSASGIQLALQNIYGLLIADKISPKTAGLALYSLQIAASNLRDVISPSRSDMPLEESPEDILTFAHEEYAINQDIAAEEIAAKQQQREREREHEWVPGRYVQQSAPAEQVEQEEYAERAEPSENVEQEENVMALLSQLANTEQVDLNASATNRPSSGQAKNLAHIQRNGGKKDGGKKKVGSVGLSTVPFPRTHTG